MEVMSFWPESFQVLRDPVIQEEELSSAEFCLSITGGSVQVLWDTVMWILCHTHAKLHI
ncbi:hypothetical protein JZ751_028515 [Albula glossodonta]|uniref:Uncharacterized protein n=1 Tax=Albula glossodonta TaxID=121402 RepID=A0A8T2MP93_9TELE|nr:hypothetical protein JZ751_009131 [Albula glossodonta]KAG9329944.1 hypothetical protein JZ751_028515 [Albula glossodonta]